MNERIRELFEQAHERKPVMVVDPQTGNPIQAGWANKPMYHNEFNPEKFAELVIEEAAKAHLCDTDGVVGKYSDSDRYYFETLMKKQLGLK